MARTPSNMLTLNTPAPDFNLFEPATGQQVCLNDFKGQALLVFFICNHCPYVIHIQTALAELVRTYQDLGIAAVGINSNDVENYPDDSPEHMIRTVQTLGYTFAYLFDETQQVARAYDAACTPDFYLFDTAHRLYYRGQFDASRPGNTEPVTGADLRAALDALLAGQTAPSNQTPSLGCNIKWKASPL